MDLQQGACIRLEPGAIEDPALPGSPSGAAPHPQGQLYQVIAVDQGRDRCWLRRWPLARHGSPVFEISLQHIHAGDCHRPLPVGRQEIASA